MVEGAEQSHIEHREAGCALSWSGSHVVTAKGLCVKFALYVIFRVGFVLGLTFLYLKVLNSPTWFREGERVSPGGLPFSLSAFFLAFISGFINNTFMLLFPEFSVWDVTCSLLSLERVSSLSPPTKWGHRLLFDHRGLHYGDLQRYLQTTNITFFFLVQLLVFGGIIIVLLPTAPWPWCFLEAPRNG